MKIIDLAEVIASKAKIKLIGIRQGEKLHEELLTTEEAQHSKEFDNHFVIEPEFPFWEKDNFKEGKPLPEGFKYSSDTNKERHNIGANKEITINNLFNLLSLQLNKEIKPIFQPSRRGEIINSRIDYSKIKKELNWQPKCNLEKGLQKTIDWFKINYGYKR